MPTNAAELIAVIENLEAKIVAKHKRTRGKGTGRWTRKGVEIEESVASKIAGVDVTITTPQTATQQRGYFQAYQIKKWLPIHEHIVLGHIAAKSNQIIADELGCTVQMVDNVLRSPQAVAKLREFTENAFKVVQGHQLSLIDRHARLGEKALQKIEGFVDDSVAQKADPFKFVDRMINIADRTKTLTASQSTNGGNVTNVQNNNLIMADSAKVDRLFGLLDKAMQFNTHGTSVGISGTTGSEVNSGDTTKS